MTQPFDIAKHLFLSRQPYIIKFLRVSIFRLHISNC